MLGPPVRLWAASALWGPTLHNTDGQTERVNRSIEEMLRAFVGKRQNDWDEQLGMVEFAYNNSVHGSSGYTPFYLCYGRHPVSLVNLLS